MISVERAREKITESAKLLDQFRSGKNRKIDPYQIALDMQIAQRELDIAASQRRAKFKVFQGGKL